MELINRQMTIKEIAEALGTSSRTVTRHVEEVYPGIKKNGVKTLLNEMQVTEVKMALEKNPYLDKGVKLPKTELEENLIIQQAQNLLLERINRLQDQVKIQAVQLEDAQPKIEFHDQVGDSEGLYSIGETAKMLGTGRNRLFKRLRSADIFFGTQPYQSYIDRGYFELKTTTANGHVQKQAFTTPKGLQWIHEKFTGLTLDGSLVKQI